MGWVLSEGLGAHPLGILVELVADLKILLAAREVPEIHLDLKILGHFAPLQNQVTGTTCWLSTMTDFTPKSTPIVEIYLATNCNMWRYKLQQRWLNLYLKKMHLFFTIALD